MAGAAGESPAGAGAGESQADGSPAGAAGESLAGGGAGVSQADGSQAGAAGESPADGATGVSQRVCPGRTAVPGSPGPAVLAGPASAARCAN
jgi:hypothetical protein